MPQNNPGHSTLQVRNSQGELFGYMPNIPDYAGIIRYTNIRTGVIMELKIDRLIGETPTINCGEYTIKDMMGVPTFLPHPEAVADAVTGSLRELSLALEPIVPLERDADLTKLPSAQSTGPSDSSDQTKK